MRVDMIRSSREIKEYKAPAEMNKDFGTKISCSQDRGHEWNFGNTIGVPSVLAGASFGGGL